MFNMEVVGPYLVYLHPDPSSPFNLTLFNIGSLLQANSSSFDGGVVSARVGGGGGLMVNLFQQIPLGVQPSALRWELVEEEVCWFNLKTAMGFEQLHHVRIIYSIISDIGLSRKAHSLYPFIAKCESSLPPSLPPKVFKMHPLLKREKFPPHNYMPANTHT